MEAALGGVKEGSKRYVPLADESLRNSRLLASGLYCSRQHRGKGTDHTQVQRMTRGWMEVVVLMAQG